MDEKIRWGIIGLVSALAVFGGYIVLSELELNHAYYCNTNNKVGIFETLSKTNVTGYWHVNETRKQSTCTKSKWIPLREYCKAKGIPDCRRIKATATEDHFTGKIWCDTKSCDDIVN